MSTPQDAMGLFFERATQVVMLAAIGYGIWRAVRPKTFHAVVGAPVAFLERLGPKLDFYSRVTGVELRTEVAGELKQMFQVSMDEHELLARDYELVFVRDDVVGDTALVRRVADGQTFTIAEFDEHLVVSSGSNREEEED